MLAKHYKIEDRIRTVFLSDVHSAERHSREKYLMWFCSLDPCIICLANTSGKRCTCTLSICAQAQG
jgi:hypothetical protein